MSAYAVENRLTREPLYEVQDIDQDQASAVMASARRGGRDLQRFTLRERRTMMRQLQARILEKRDWILDRVIEETGKSRTDALVSEVMGVLDYIHWLHTRGWKALREEKAHTPLALMGKASRIRHEPLGVVFVVAPWNYPFHIAMTSIAAALMAGNGVVFKPSEVTPLMGVIEAILEPIPALRQAVQVVYGGGKSGQALIDQRPDKICFTGSTATGQRILAQAAEYLIPVELELGGKDPAIVFDDVDLDRTVAGVLWGGMTNAGQSCTAIERVYVQRKIYNAFRDRLIEAARALVVNPGDEGDADIGSITPDFQLDLIIEQMEQAQKSGARVCCGGQTLDSDCRLYPPTVVEGLNTDQPLARDETFGPVLPLFPFDSEEEAIAMANDSEMGLSASVWSRDLKRARRVAEALEVGAVSINNVMVTEGNPDLPFGGVGMSGYGRVKGVEGLRAMTRSKAVMVDKQSSKLEANWYPYTRRKYRLFDQLIQGLFGRGIARWLTFARAGLGVESEAQKPRG
ncbi:aldehyde dehydrogenase family protein [Marinobacteraceae bacterium S3BR75-40.1]